MIKDVVIKDGELRTWILIASSALLGWALPLGGWSTTLSAVAYSALLHLASDALMRAARPGFDLESVSAHAVGISAICALAAHQLPSPAVVGVGVSTLVVLVLALEAVSRLSSRRRPRVVPVPASR
ncbi:hypothetical protein [Nocardioides lianchengensis]|uniref:Uncharacterized protein n=1 Tax=Nocardioides lianchengensis TaxID=1045774 RepID=A0A1G6R752_9ACTN|nr:hypothetical protein [Nocardioides lianchengensis]NYG10345.1 hypothetical protein [Nocardioides lianchengensis]SDD00271.1 hypothetical protein SAMN05421872_105173 [Nocardioides lianchengensis]